MPINNADALKELLKGLSDVEVRELFIEGIRRWREQHAGQTQISLAEIAFAVLPVLAERRRFAANGSQPQEGMIAITHQGLEGVSEFIGWFVRAGFAWPLGAEANRYPYTLHLTRAGLRFLDGTEDHPLLPGFVDRLTTRCPQLPDDVQALLIDALSCLMHALMRPAIQLVGVAYEVAIEHVVDAMAQRGTLQANVADAKAARRIDAVKAVIPEVLTGKSAQERDERFAVERAYDFADQLRQRRNDASHTAPRYDFSDRAEAEEYFVSAGRHLPFIWRMQRP